MQPLSKLSLSELELRRAGLAKEIAAAVPDLWQEFLLVQNLIRNYGANSDRPYSKIKWPKTAIPLSLERNRAWMTKEQIQRDLELGGFVFDPKTFPYLLADALRYHASRGTLARRDAEGKPIQPGSHKSGTRFRNEEYGLPEWVKDRSVTSLK